jgi:hypothetical protein
MATYSRRRSGPWYGEERERVLFERDARSQFPTLRRQLKQLDGQGPGCSYLVQIDVWFYQTRCVEVFFSQHGIGEVPVILADGPKDSPHRFGDFERQRLCVWYQDDPAELRWTHQDGLLHLLQLVRAHLFREAWWRETGRGEWLGPQAPHGATRSGTAQ